MIKEKQGRAQDSAVNPVSQTQTPSPAAPANGAEATPAPITGGQTANQAPDWGDIIELDQAIEAAVAMQDLLLTKLESLVKDYTPTDFQDQCLAGCSNLCGNVKDDLEASLEAVGETYRKMRQQLKGGAR